MPHKGSGEFKINSTRLPLPTLSTGRWGARKLVPRAAHSRDGDTAQHTPEMVRQVIGRVVGGRVVIKFFMQPVDPCRMMTS